MANYELVEDEKGDFYDTVIYDRTSPDQYSKPQKISFAGKGITLAKLFINKTDTFATPDKTVVLSLLNDFTVRWSINSVDIPATGDYYVQIMLYNVAGSLVRRTWEPLTMKVKPKQGPNP